MTRALSSNRLGVLYLYILRNNQHTFFAYDVVCHTSYITGVITACSAGEAVCLEHVLGLNGLDL